MTTTTAETFRQDACDATVKRISRVWSHGRSLRDLKHLLPAVDANLEAAQKRLDDTWLAARGDMATQAEFQADLDAWEAENYRAIAALKVVKQ